MNIHVSNLHVNVTESDLRKLFYKYGEVVSVNLVKDKLSNRSRGRAYVKMQTATEGKDAITALNGNTIQGKRIVVSELNYDPGTSTHSFQAEYE